MRKLIVSFALMIVSLAINAQEDKSVNTDSLLTECQNEIALLQQRLSQLESTLLSQKHSIRNVQKELTTQSVSIQEIAQDVSNNSNSIASVSDTLQTQINSVQSESYTLSNQLGTQIKEKAIIGLGIGAVLLCLICLLFTLLRNRIKNNNSSITAIKEAQRRLQEEAAALDGKLIEIVEKQIDVLASQPEEKKDKDHSLAIKVADEIVRIETNLSRMDPATRGFKQLSASVRRIKDNFAANGYEILDMLGKPYNEGMKVIADFIPDDNLKEGEQIITGITKPQINFNGVMIQAAQITVSQNI